MEGTFDGTERLNFYRRTFGLPEIDPAGRDRLFTLKFHERELREFVAPHFELVRVQSVRDVLLPHEDRPAAARGTGAAEL